MTDEARGNRPKARPIKAFEKLPINKGAGGDAAEVRRLPQINNPLTIGALSLGARLVGPLVRNLKPSRRPGRPEHFRQRLLRTIQSAPVVAEVERMGGFDIQVEVQESFGKPVLVSVDLCIPEPSPNLEERLRDPEKKGLRLLLSDLLARIVEAVWDNPEIAPVAIRGRLVVRQGDSSASPPESHLHLRGRPGSSGEETVLLDMTALGYVDEIARPRDLYDRYGAPVSDPQWRP